MRILEARARDFRNLREVALAFSPTVNLLLGANGQGKTSVLEALAFVALGRSHRGARPEELIRLGAPHLDVALTVEDEAGRPLRFEYAIERGGGRRLKVDGQELVRRSDLVGRFACVIFDPPTVGLIAGGPERRRRFVDLGLSLIDRAYLEALQAYQRVLRQKTSLLHELRRGRVRRGEVAADLAAWNDEFARLAAVVGRRRAAYTRLLTPSAGAAHAVLAGGRDGLELAYRPRLQALRGSGADLPEAQLEREIRQEIDYIGEDEIRRGRPLAGPHLDDFEVRLGGLALRVYGSQGETRTAAIALILAQSDVVHREMRIRPVLFFDDIFSELDRDRARRLQEIAVRDHQVFIATARETDVAGWRPAGLRAWRVEAGRLTASAEDAAGEGGRELAG